MSYVERYNFDFFSTRDLRSPLDCDEYEVKILERDGVTATEEISAQESPVIISYTNNSDNKLLPLRGSECVLNLIATEDFQLEDLYTEDERYWLVQIGRKGIPLKLMVNWSVDEDTSGVDTNLEIFVNNVRVVNTFVSSSGSFSINKGDTVLIKPFSYSSVPGNNGVNLAVTGLPTQRSVTFPFALDTTVNPTTDITIFLQSTYSATDYTAIRSGVFQKTCSAGSTGNLVTFTKEYTSAVSQAAAQSLADADAGFDAEGQAYAETNGVCNLDYSLIWQGFIIPDGCQESWMFTPYTIQVNATDGLGLLKNLSFVQNSGGIAYATTKMQEYQQAALAILHSYPESAERTAMQELVSYVINRKY
jgi:hypothetical protein